MKNQTQIRINETHLGTDATEQEARKMVTLLQQRGYDIEYGDKLAREGDENANQIPDAEWQEVLSEVLAGE